VALSYVEGAGLEARAPVEQGNEIC
jgi:hypothetical protein